MVRTLEFVEKLNDNLLGTICDYALRLAEAKDRAIAAEEELAIQSWRAEENLKSSLEYQRQLAACADDRERIRKAALAACDGHIERRGEAINESLLATRKAQDMEYRAQNAEVNARYYWKELQSEQAKAKMYKQERDFERQQRDAHVCRVVVTSTNTVNTAAIGG